MMQQAQDFLDESEAVFALVSPLSDAGLETPTLFKQWTISDIIGHLHMWNWAADLSLKDGPAFRRFWDEVTAHMSAGKTLTAFERAWLGDLKGKALVAAWREFYLPMASRFGASDPAARVVWAGPDMSVRSSITARLMETWAHAQAIYDILARDRHDGARLRNIVVLGVNTYGWTFANRKQQAPQPMPHVRLTGPSGETWAYGEESVGERIEGSATAFCQVVAQTRNIADVDLTVIGPNARLWMDNAQCFAGPPETPPAPGVRHKSTAPFVA
ncbi:TIGR03084 family protein [Camelimonas fluminis]|uniref:TIGR03084 family metal-binding protein n=1 Tax=Camelimonas fluminis TaxID=1576911 RepID=A0ABV7UKU4_9HYPH|nr:TIGR03084 family metal-binding protein [Camelimonas fluminis]GHE61336.1 TIGR03084 family protein [Camelimonas fluminis]